MITDAFTAGPAATIAISGATGLIGRALASHLQSRGHTVRRLVRSTRDTRPGDVRWDPARGELDHAALAGVTAVVHLAGEPVAQRWTPGVKAAIRSSRVEGTMLLARAVAALDPAPTVFLGGSAVGYYGDRGDELLDESSEAGNDFLAGVTRAWEAAARPAADAGIRTVALRTGIVLDATGGALHKLLVPFKLGIGGPIGSGRQWMSWIALEDEVRAIEHALWTSALIGPVNLVAPNPVTNAEFSSVLGRVLARPALLTVPRFAVELLYGEMADATILAGQRALPRALLASNFEFIAPTLEQALRRVLGR
jgi:uncharacterized protein (TIGR01777 family)